MPCLHSPAVATSVPSASIHAQAKNSGGCPAQTFRRATSNASCRSCKSSGESSAKVAGRGGIRNAFGAQGVQIGLVLAAQLQVFQARPAAQRVVRQVQHVVPLVIRQMNLEQRRRWSISRPPQAAHQLMHQPDAAAGRAHRSPGQLIFDVGGPQHGPREVVRIIELVQASRQSPLACRTALLDNPVHSKSLRGLAGSWSFITHETPQTPEGFRVFCAPTKNTAPATLV